MATTIPFGFPDSTNSGVPAGTPLTAYTGPMTISTDGAVIDGKIIDGSLRITGANVVLKNCVITYNDYWGVDAEGAKNVTIQNCTITGPGAKGTSTGVILGSGNFLGNNISGGEHGIVLTDGASVVKGNYLHDGGSALADPHIGGISLKGGQSNVLIEDNTVIGKDTSDIFLQNIFGPITNVVINHNYLAGTPGYNIYVEGRFDTGPTTGVSITNNYIVKGYYGYYSTSEATPEFSGNIEVLPGQTPNPSPNPTPDPTPTPVPEQHTFFGTSGSDVMHGTTGVDTMTGGRGNDIYYVDNAGDKVVEASRGGGDAVLASVNYALSVGSQVEKLATTNASGTAAINLTGNEFGQTINGNAGANILDGLGGADTMTGNGGNDTYIVDNSRDKVVETAGGGDDTVQSSLSYALSRGSQIEHLATTSPLGTTDINLTGNEFAQIIDGNAGANTIDGRGGADVLSGLGGNDVFVFRSALGPGNVDYITDFSVSQDKILLDHTVFAGLQPGSLSASAFFAGTGAHDTTDRIIYNSSTGALYFDSDGSGGAQQTQFATLSAHLPLSASSFIIS